MIVSGSEVIFTNTRIREIRSKKKLNQTEFGKKVGLSRDTIANIEGGRIEIKDVFIKSICKEFNVNETWLRTGEGEMFNALDMENELMAWAGKILGENDSFKKRFVRMLMSLNEDEWEFIARKAKELADYEEQKKD